MQNQSKKYIFWRKLLKEMLKEIAQMKRMKNHGKEIVQMKIIKAIGKYSNTCSNHVDLLSENSNFNS